MAKFDGKFFKGMVGPVVYKQYRGMQLVTAKSTLTLASQTENTKKAAAAFGLTSSLAADLRKNLCNIVTGFYDGTMVYRFKKLVQEAIYHSAGPEAGAYNFTANSFERLNGFEFNATSPVASNFFIQPEQELLGDNLMFKLPELRLSHDLKFPNNATSCLLHIAVGMYDLTYGHKTICPVQSVEVLNEGSVIPAQSFEFTVVPGCLCITVLSFQYMQQTFSGQQIINSKAFNPVAVFSAVMADGAVLPEQTSHWQPMRFKTIS